MQKTANQIKSSFETLASGHYQIHSFLYAQEFEQQAYENLIYPLMLVYPLGGSLSGTTYSRNYRVVIADRVLKSEGNELEVESDTQLIALDVLAYWMKLGTNERFSITSSNTITPFWEKWGDEVTGHFVDIGIEEFYDFNSCAIPLSGSIPTPVNPCKDARISVNSVVYGNAPSDSNFNVVVKDQDGDLVGSLIGGEWIVNTGGSCADATYTIEDTLGNILYTGSIVSGGSLTQAIGNSTLNVNNSAGTLISSESILAEGTDSYNVADSVAVIKDSLGTTLKSENILATASENITINDSVAVIKDSANNTLKSENILAEATENISISDSVAVIKNSVGTTLKSENILAQATENITINDSSVENSDATYSVDVLAEGSLILPDSQINVNGVDSGDVVSVKTIDVNLEDSVGDPVTPTSVGLVGNTLTIEVPSGGATMTADFSADFTTIRQSENVTFTDLSDQSPTNWGWNFNNEGSSFVQNPVFAFTETGLKTITLLAAKDGVGDFNTKANYIEVVIGRILTRFGNSAAAWSLRKLRTAYSGNFIRVRRSSDNTEQDIGFDGDGLDTTSLLSFVGAGNGFVTTIYDQSGNGRNATQTTAASQPQIVNSGSVILTNGKPSIKFDGLDDFLTTSYVVANIGLLTVEYVMKFNTLANQVASTISEGTFKQLYLQWINSSNFNNFYANTTNTTPATTNQIISSFYMGFNNGGFYTNGTLLAAKTQVNSSGASNVTIGRFVSGSFNTDMNFQEMIIWESDKQTDRTGIQSNINSYYNVF